jgi:hypothetical protein
VLARQPPPARKRANEASTKDLAPAIPSARAEDFATEKPISGAHDGRVDAL